MQVFFYVLFLIVIGIAIFAIQNSDAPLIMVRFLSWRFETSLVYTILGSIGLGIFIVLLFWIPMAVRASFKKKTDQGISST